MGNKGGQARPSAPAASQPVDKPAQATQPVTKTAAAPETSATPTAPVVKPVEPKDDFLVEEEASNEAQEGESEEQSARMF